MPISNPEVTTFSVPGVTPGEAPEPRPRVTVGTEGDDRIELGGATALGAGGNDVFVLTSNGPQDEPEKLGTILDYGDGDQLDLSKLGEHAQVLGSDRLAAGGQRFSIDIDGDGKEDGFVLAYVDHGDAASDGVVTIQPFPMPGDDGVVTIQPYPLPGEVTILPFPMPGDGEGVFSITFGEGEGEASILPFTSGFAADWIAA